MNEIEIITYATHSEGTFDKLINNEYNIPITVLGWGKKWNGFIDKFKNVLKYLDTVSDDKIIIFLDGFDTKINTDLITIYNRFKEFDNDIIVSMEKGNNYIYRKVFGVCYNNLIANSGLYGGYNKSLKILLKFILDKNYSTDDQRNLNDACKYFGNIQVDENEYLFQNQGYFKRYFNNKSNSCFVSTPGVLSCDRLQRVPCEYLPFLWKELITVIVILLCIMWHRDIATFIEKFVFQK